MTKHFLGGGMVFPVLETCSQVLCLSVVRNADGKIVKIKPKWVEKK